MPVLATLWMLWVGAIMILFAGIWRAAAVRPPVFRPADCEKSLRGWSTPGLTLGARLSAASMAWAGNLGKLVAVAHFRRTTLPRIPRTDRNP